MAPGKQAKKLIFNPAPLHFSAICREVFPDADISLAIFPLDSLKPKDSSILSIWLHQKEQLQLEQFSLEKRSREWLGGRICAKQSARMFFQRRKNQTIIPNYSQCRIQSDADGRPSFQQLEGLDIDFPELSISHSKKIAAAMSSLPCCGIDIQFAAATLERVQEKFCSSKEEQTLKKLVPNLPRISRLTLLWSAKEAAKKMLSPEGIPGFQELTLLHNSRSDNGVALFSFAKTGSQFPIQTVATMFRPDYALAICCRQNTEGID
ncbi:MAG: hypothetical protein DSY80_06220 [Desulfocapsa sp.]|nr:MAG: hypothetical protein DSY80_06220 [Desulfocapsa sp.]